MNIKMTHLHLMRGFSVALLLVTFVLASGSLVAQGKIKVEGGDTYDWGTVAPGKLHAAIKVWNTGTGELKIDEVRPSCGCTTSPIDKNLLKPGEFGTINITLDVASRTGPVEKTVTIHSNDAEAPYLVLHLKANIKRTLTFIPSNYFIITDAEKGVMSQSAPVRIMNTGEKPFTVNPPSLTAGNVKATFSMTEPRELKPNEELEISMQVTPLDGNSMYGEVTMTSTSEEYPTIVMQITGSMKAPVVNPSATPDH